MLLCSLKWTITFRGENRIAEKSLLLTKKQERECLNDKREDEGPRPAYFSREWKNIALSSPESDRWISIGNLSSPAPRPFYYSWKSRCCCFLTRFIPRPMYKEREVGSLVRPYQKVYETLSRSVMCTRHRCDVLSDHHQVTFFRRKLRYKNGSIWLTWLRTLITRFIGIDKYQYTRMYKRLPRVGK